jgi:hypothetical protein
MMAVTLIIFMTALLSCFDQILQGIGEESNSKEKKQ